MEEEQVHGPPVTTAEDLVAGVFNLLASLRENYVRSGLSNAQASERILEMITVYSNMLKKTQ